MKRIAATSGAGAKMLKRFGREDASIRLDDIGLPPGETSTREAIAPSKKKLCLAKAAMSLN